MGWSTRGPDDLDADERARIRYQVLSSLRGRSPTFADRAYDVVAIAALPAPHIVRALILLAALVGIAATATVASADSLPDDALYGLKLAGEQVRLALAVSPADRAAVELSMAEHRLAEATQLALGGRSSDALVATSAYGEHLASAAAALASVERSDPSAGMVVARLTERVAAQQLHAATVVADLGGDAGDDARSPFRTIALVVPLSAGTTTVSAQIAEHAATVTEHIASEAARIARGSDAPPSAASSRPPSGDGRTERPSASPVRGTDAPRASAPAAAARTQSPEPPGTAAPRPTPRETARTTPDPHAAQNAADKAKAEAEKARAAAEKAKEAAKKTPGPTATPHR